LLLKKNKKILDDGYKVPYIRIIAMPINIKAIHHIFSFLKILLPSRGPNGNRLNTPINALT
jgi:hypothetical protein